MTCVLDPRASSPQVWGPQGQRYLHCTKIGTYQVHVASAIDHFHKWRLVYITLFCIYVN